MTPEAAVGASLRLDPHRAVLLVVDFQERLAAAMPAEACARAARNVAILIDLARRLKMPVVASEQYPQGLGATVAAVREALDAAGGAWQRLEKTTFSCAGAPGFADLFRQAGRPLWIVAGMEAHVCVYQTVRDLTALGAVAHVPADAVLSRSADNLRTGLDLIARAGGIVTSTETVVFDALGRAGTEDFRALARLVK